MQEVLLQDLQQVKWNHLAVAYLRSRKQLLLRTIEQVSVIQYKAIILKQTHISHLMRHIQQVRIQAMEQLNFQWVTPELTSKPQWTIVTEGSDFSLVENFLAPGLDAVSVINRTQTIETQTTSLSIFSQ